MKIAIASGKGGTGKTTVAANLAGIFSRSGWGISYLDCDVEAPNSHLFLKPDISAHEPATTLIPKIDPTLCTHCGACADFCGYNALLCLSRQVLAFPELCHACGGCRLVCPMQAISEVPREIGKIDLGHAGSIAFARGLLNIGEAMSPPLIRALKAKATPAEVTIVDAPPGTSCPVIESIRDSDYVALVTEPTPFGLNDLQLAVEMVRALELPFGVILNRAGRHDRIVLDYCGQEKIPLLAQFPDDRRVAEAYSRGEMISEVLPEFQARFSALAAAIALNVSGGERIQP
ncbi:MAG: ATP-binding protein [Syntrophotaleaceae bacterium]